MRILVRQSRSPAFAREEPEDASLHLVAVGHFVQDFDRELVMLLLIVMMVLIIDYISNYCF